MAVSGRRMLRESTERAPRDGSSRRGLAAAAKATNRYLPLPAGMLVAQQEVEQLGLNVEEASEVVAAQAMGTLDSYLYANNAVDSASSESHRTASERMFRCCFAEAGPGISRCHLLAPACLLCCCAAGPYRGERIRFASRVTAVGPGWVQLDRPLPYDLRTAWQPGVYAFTQYVQHSGWEDFTIINQFGERRPGSASTWLRCPHTPEN